MTRPDRPPFGWRVVASAMVKDEDEQKIIDIITRDHRERGWDVNRIAKQINEDGYLYRGKPFTKQRVERCLKRGAAK